MPASLSMDLRERIVAAYECGDVSCRVVGTRFGVSPGTVSKLVRQSRVEGSLKPRYERCGRKRSIRDKTEEALRKHVREHPDATLQERKEALVLTCSIKTVWLSLKRLKARFKKSHSERPSRIEKMLLSNVPTGLSARQA
jgi:transposase